MVFTCSGQNTREFKIDSLCDSINKEIVDEITLPHTVSCIVNRPAIGIQKTNLKFFYNTMYCEHYDYDPLTDSVLYIVNPVLCKVVMDYNIAASELVRKEYYYKKEKLVCFVAVINSIYNDQGIDSLKAYFDGSNMLKIEKYNNLFVAEVTPADKKVAEDALLFANEYLVFFRQMNALEYKQH